MQSNENSKRERRDGSQSAGGGKKKKKQGVIFPFPLRGFQTSLSSHWLQYKRAAIALLMAAAAAVNAVVDPSDCWRGSTLLHERHSLRRHEMLSDPFIQFCLFVLCLSGKIKKCWDVVRLTSPRWARCTLFCICSWLDRRWGIPRARST